MTCEVEASKITEWVAVVVAILALIATAWQGYIARRHNKLSVQPMIVSQEEKTLPIRALLLAIQSRMSASALL